MNATIDRNKVRCARCDEVIGEVLSDKNTGGSFIQWQEGYVREVLPDRWIFKMPEQRRKRFLRGEAVAHHRKELWHLENMEAGEVRRIASPLRVGLAVVESLRVQVDCAKCTCRNEVKPWS